MANEVGDANATEELNYKHDVYLSFRGRDTPNKFISVFYAAFDEKNLSYRDGSKALIRLNLDRVMKESRILVIFISENYASTEWCLEELVMMLELMKLKSQKVCPVFYGVDPSDVRYQGNKIEAAWKKLVKKHESEPNKVKKWRSALVELTNLSGWHFHPDHRAGYEGEFARKIADWISRSVFRYDVYLSFSGEDPGYSFTGLLCNVLRQEGFKTYMDDKGWLKGNQLSRFCIQAIKESKISIIVFSENYAKYPCCLDALIEIMEYKKSKNQKVFPIFYKVLPEDVERQLSHYEEARDEHEEKLENESEKVLEWRSALLKVAEVKGWHFKSGDYYEYKTIKEIVKSVNQALPRYDIFLSFRGRDTCYTFTGNLYYALCKKGIKTFMDDEAIKAADEISDTLTHAIEGSRISIIVFSENYANSSSCLHELVHILKCNRVKYYVVLPIYYKVERSDVRDQKNSYFEDMAEHEKRLGKRSVKKWRSAMYDFANSEKHHHHSFRTGEDYKGEFARKIVDWISRSIFRSAHQDDKGWQNEDQLSQFRIQAIKDSKISIIVFSENYVKYPCCIDALIDIMEHKKSKKQQVFPIFYKVLPDDVKHQLSHYEQARDEHKKMLGNVSEKVRKWRSAFRKVDELKGWYFKSGDYYEYKTIIEIVESVNKALPRYEVFLSFRGPDTRYTFTGNLYYALCKKGIKTFMDDEAIKAGDEISDSLIHAIEGSRISIIVFSENYASSSSCLDELVHIRDCTRVKYHVVLPIYYKVERSDVWDQKNSYFIAMAEHEKSLGKESVKKWRSALYDVAKSEEHHHHSFRTGYEHEFIDEIVEKIGRI